MARGCIVHSLNVPVTVTEFIWSIWKIICTWMIFIFLSVYDLSDIWWAHSHIWRLSTCLLLSKNHSINSTATRYLRLGERRVNEVLCAPRQRCCLITRFSSFFFSPDSEQNEADVRQLWGRPHPRPAPASSFPPFASHQYAPTDPSQRPLPYQSPITSGGQCDQALYAWCFWSWICICLLIIRQNLEHQNPIFVYSSTGYFLPSQSR